MISTQGLFEAHFTVASLERSMKFYSKKLGLELATELREPRAAFYWLGGHGKSMLGLWEAGPEPQRISLHVAFTAKLEDVIEAPRILRQKGIQALDFTRRPTKQAVVIGWMPAAVVYFHDPDNNLLELLAMLPDKPRPGAGVVSWDQWRK
jgi:catechol 2,3-dioxygenase-like lactoylglutathione lyase family enzyme